MSDNSNAHRVGWAVPPRAMRQHYFPGTGVSICRHHADDYEMALAPEPLGYLSPCGECWRRHMRRIERERAR